jgi:hypothetical protein
MSLDLSSNQIGAGGAKHLADALRQIYCSDGKHFVESTFTLRDLAFLSQYWFAFAHWSSVVHVGVTVARYGAKKALKVLNLQDFQFAVTSDLHLTAVATASTWCFAIFNTLTNLVLLANVVGIGSKLLVAMVQIFPGATTAADVPLWGSKCKHCGNPKTDHDHGNGALTKLDVRSNSMDIDGKGRCTQAAKDALKKAAGTRFARLKFLSSYHVLKPLARSPCARRTELLI